MPVPDIALEVTRAGRALVPWMALENPAVRRRAITVFAALAVLEFLRIAITDERTPGMPHLLDAVDAARDGARAAWVHLLAWPILSPVLILAAAIGGLAIWSYARFGRREWLGSGDIVKKLADPEIMKDVEAAWEDMRRWEQSIEALREERSALAAPYNYLGVVLPPKVAHLYRKFGNAQLKVDDRVHLAGEAHRRALARALEEVYGKLRDGRLVARGRKAPVTGHGKIIRIPAEHWEVIRFNWDCCSGPFVFSDRVKFADFTGASNDDLQYYGVEVARA